LIPELEMEARLVPVDIARCLATCFHKETSERGSNTTR